MKKLVALVLALTFVLVSTGCSSDTSSHAQDMSKVIEARCQSIEDNILVVTVHKVYGTEVSTTTHTTYNVDISNVELEIDSSVLESPDYPIWIIPAEIFSEDNQNIVAKKIGGYSN